MPDWTLAQEDPSQELAQLHFFSVMTQQPDGKVEFRITVREYAARNPLHMRFFAQADRQTNQGTASFTPSGWGDTLLAALGECIRAIKLFPYEGEIP